MSVKSTSRKELEAELEEVRRQLYEANETIEAIRTGQVDALIVHDGNEHQLYTLRTADQGYRAFIEKMNEGAVTLNESGIILYCNSTFAKMVREPIYQVTGRALTEFVSEGAVEKFNRLLKQGLTGVSKGEVDLKTSMLPLPVQVSFTVFKMEEIVSVSVIITDLSEQKKTQVELQQKNYLLAESNKALETSNHDLQQFASVASHDLQEPLRKIQIFSNLLNEKDSGDLSPEARKYISKIIQSSERMKTLIIDLLNYSKLSSSDEPFHPISLNEVIDEVIEDLEMIILEKNAEISVDLLPQIIANRGQMRQVFQNLLYNALKFSRDGIRPKIQIRNEPDENIQGASSVGYCCFSIRDNGIGFSQKHADNIFSLFKRLHSKDAFEGSGIGLAITRKIIEKHHGTILARSEEGSGAKFLISLPQNQ